MGSKGHNWDAILLSELNNSSSLSQSDMSPLSESYRDGRWSVRMQQSQREKTYRHTYGDVSILRCTNLSKIIRPSGLCANMWMVHVFLIFKWSFIYWLPINSIKNIQISLYYISKFLLESHFLEKKNKKSSKSIMMLYLGLSDLNSRLQKNYIYVCTFLWTAIGHPRRWRTASEVPVLISKN